MQSIVTSKIELEIENMPQSEAETLRNYFILLISAQIHKVKNGKVILYFDNIGLSQIASNKILWRRKSNKTKDASS